MKQRTLTKEEQILVLETQIKERALIVYADESALADTDDSWPIGYATALKDEIENHKMYIEEYKEQLKQLQK